MSIFPISRQNWSLPHSNRFIKFEVNGIKKPSTSELIDWLKLLLAEDIPAEVLHSKKEIRDSATAGRY